MIAAIILATLVNFAPGPPNAPTAMDVARDADLSGLVVDYAPDGVTIKVDSCGQVNAFYDLNGHVTVCSELIDSMVQVLGPIDAAKAVRFAALHEIGHAVFAIDDTPFTGNEELAADEYATVELLAAGEDDATLAMAKYMVIVGSAEDDPTDPHPSTYRRAATILSYTRGATHPGDYPADFEAFYRAMSAWTRLLGR